MKEIDIDKIDVLLHRIHILDRSLEGKEFYSTDKLCGKHYGRTKTEFEIELLKMEIELFKMKEGLIG